MRFSIFFLFFLIGTQAWGERPIFQQYDVNDGLPSSFIYDIAQDDGGLIWIATDKGISKFDGNRFTNYTVKDGLPNNDVFGLVKDQQGRIWLNTHDHCSFIENGKIYQIDSDKKLEVHKHYFDQRGNHFISGGLSSKNYLLTDSLEINELAYSKQFILSYQNDQNYTALVSKNSAHVIRKVSNGTQEDKTLNIRIAYRKFFDGFWFNNKHYFFAPTGVEVLKDDDLIHKDFRSLGFEEKIKQCFYVGEGKMILKNANKVLLLDSDFNTLRSLEFLKDVEIFNVLIDKEQNLWIATDDGIVFISILSLESQSFYFGPQKRSSNETATKIIKDSNGNILVATIEGNIYKYNDGKLEQIIETGLSGLRDMAQDSYGKLWLATEGLGCFRLSNLPYINDTQYHYSLINNDVIKTKSQRAIFRATVKALQMGPDNRLYIASAEGVSRVEFKENHYEIDKLDSLRSYSVAQDLFGFIWIGRTSGISRYKDGKLINLGPSHPISNLSVTDIDVDYENGLWFGSDGYGLFHDKGSILCQIEELDGFIIKSLFIDESNMIWAATNRGVVNIKAEGDNPENCDYKLNFYTIAHGLASEEVNDILVDNGILFAATKKGVSILPIDSNSPNEYSSPLIIGSVLINGKSTEIKESYNLDYDQNDLKIDFAALSYKSLGNVSYDYQMTGIDSTWQTTNERFREYQTLIPGSYEFKLRARDVNGQTLSDEKSIKFTIKRPWWNRWWFRLFYFLAAIFLFFGYSQYRISQAEQKAARENEVNKKFAELEMQAIRSQMNPHFLFNALQSIQDYIFKNDSREANKYISSFAKLMRKILDASKEKYTYLIDELEMINLYMELEKLRFQDKFDFKIEIDPDIDINSTEIPTMVIQPFVENAINHGLVHRIAEGVLLLSINKKGEEIELVIEDNGIGIDKAIELKRNAGLNHNSQGMKMITNRMELMNEMYNTQIEYSLDKSDASNKDYPGTRVTIRIPNF